MKKLATTEFSIHPLLQKRWSPRAFDTKEVSKEIIDSLLEALRWAPSCFNEQPWRLLIARKHHEQEAYQTLLSTLVPINQEWAQHAPILLLTTAKKVFSHNQNPNRHAMHDLGLAMENLVIQATHHELIVHQMAGFRADEVQAQFQISDEFEVASVTAIGYPGNVEQLSEGLQKKEREVRVRKSAEELFSWGNWNF